MILSFLFGATLGALLILLFVVLPRERERAETDARLDVLDDDFHELNQRLVTVEAELFGEDEGCGEVVAE